MVITDVITDVALDGGKMLLMLFILAEGKFPAQSLLRRLSAGEAFPFRSGTGQKILRDDLRILFHKVHGDDLRNLLGNRDDLGSDDDHDGSLVVLQLPDDSENVLGLDVLRTCSGLVVRSYDVHAHGNCRNVRVNGDRPYDDQNAVLRDDDHHDDEALHVRDGEVRDVRDLRISAPVSRNDDGILSMEIVACCTRDKTF